MSSIVSEAALAQQKLNSIKSYKEVSEDITAQLSDLFPPHFLLTIPFSQLRHYPRYMKAIQVRIDRLKNDPGRDAERMARFVSLRLITRGSCLPEEASTMPNWSNSEYASGAEGFSFCAGTQNADASERQASE